RGREGPTRIPEAQRAWFADRAALPDIAPSTPPLVGDGAIVLLLGIDSMRAHLLADEAYRAKLPELFRLKDESTYFADARSAGSATVPSLSTLFSGLYYSQLYWTELPHNPFVFPYEDDSPRFPELLHAAGIGTSIIDATPWLSNENGVVRGFGQHRAVHKKK